MDVEMDDTTPRKRPRPVVSCLRCRDKKLKCDRIAPCENCVKARLADSCEYQHNTITSSKTSSPVLAVSANAFVDLQSRLAKVEELLGIRTTEDIMSKETTKPQAIGTVVVKGSRSNFHGQNDRTTLLNQFLEVKEFINEMSHDRQIQASAKQIKFLQNKSRSKIGSPDSIISSCFSIALLQLREFLPPKEYCDRLVAIYSQHFERTFRILHIPTFMRRCEQIWASDNADICTSSSILPELTAVMTMAYHMDGAQQLGDDKNYRMYLKGPAMDLIQAWLDELGRKQRAEISTLQVDILLLLSRSQWGIQPERLWSSTGALVRCAMIMGFNVDPASISGISPYNAEMRRRLWATILEMDLQASMFCNMPLVVPEINPASLSLSNINDVDFDEASVTLPASKSKNTYTDNIYQVILASSLPQRIRALSIIQHFTPDIQEGISLGRTIEECLSQKPQITDLRNNGAPLDGGSLLHRVLLDLYLRRPLLRLYKALLLGHQNNKMLAEIQKHCLESSQVLLSYQEFYTIPALTAMTNSPWAYQNFFYQCCKMDILWAALTLCEQIKRHSGPEKIVEERDSSFFVRAVETTVTYLIDRIGQKGSDLKDIVFLALALQSVQLTDTITDRSYHLQQTARTILARCREKLLQTLGTDEPIATTQPVKGSSTEITPVRVPIPDTVKLPISASSLTPVPLTDTAFLSDLPASSERWFGDLSDLAVEYNAFQTGVFDSNDPLNFGISQNWNWEHMWQ